VGGRVRCSIHKKGRRYYEKRWIMPDSEAPERSAGRNGMKLILEAQGHDSEGARTAFVGGCHHHPAVPVPGCPAARLPGLAIETSQEEEFLYCADEVAFTEKVRRGADRGVQSAQHLDHLFTIQPDDGDPSAALHGVKSSSRFDLRVVRSLRPVLQEQPRPPIERRVHRVQGPPQC
jgi:hypothetical protein